MNVPTQHKRLRRINAGATSGNSNKSDNEIQEFDVGNISEEETEEEIPVEYLNLLKPVVSVLRQSAGFFWNP